MDKVLLHDMLGGQKCKPDSTRRPSPAYDLDRDQTAFVLEDFHRVRNPRLMDEAYFEMVLGKYDHLAPLFLTASPCRFTIRDGALSGEKPSPRRGFLYCCP